MIRLSAFPIACRAVVLLSILGLPAVAAEDVPPSGWRTAQARIGQALLRQGIIDSGLALVHLNPVCDVTPGGGNVFHVVETRELVRGGPSPRGFNQVVMLDRALRVTARAELTSARPLYCDGDAVVLDRPVDVSGFGQEGNLLRIDRRGRIAEVGRLEAADMRGFSFRVRRPR